jgi:BASS family bile acid:Na+ symporter
MEKLARFIHRQFLWLVLGSYALAAVWPAVGLWIREAAVGQFAISNEEIRLTFPVLLLAILLWNAGLGVHAGELRHILRNPRALLSGLLANLILPLAFIFAIGQLMRLWHNPDETQNILVGLALIAAMPIAGSSTAWSQKTNGNMVLSVGLVLLSTLLSPLTTPVALHSVGFMTTGDYSEDLHELAATGTGIFLGLFVVVPLMLGILTRCVTGKAWLAMANPHLKLVNVVVLLLLLYTNASTSLPQAVSVPDWDFLAVMLAIVMGLCLVTFGFGWVLGHLLKTNTAERTSLMYGLGMNNNGTGLVLASMALPAHPMVMLPIILYNLVQHLAAGVVDFVICRKPALQRALVAGE